MAGAMRACTLVLFGIGSAFALPATGRVELEPGLVFSAPNWAAVRRCTAKDTVNAMFMLRHDSETLREMEELFWAVSDPTSPKYGDHLTQADLAAKFGPRAGAVAKVSSWLTAAGVSFTVSGARDIIEATMTATTAAKLFDTEFHAFRHTRASHQVNRAVRSYSVPAELAQHLDIVGDLVALPAVDAPPRVAAPEPTSADATAREAAEWPTDCDKVSAITRTSILICIERYGLWH